MKKVLITGASSGIGKALYDCYKTQPGYGVTGVSRRGPDIQLDLGQPPSLIKDAFKVQGIDASSARFNLLVNCAGIMPFRETGQVFAVNFWAAYNLIELFKNPNLVVVNIASISGQQPEHQLPLYAASKAALLSLTASLARKYASFGMRVNSISPGFFKTDLVPAQTPQELIDTIPMKREGKPFELFDVVRLIENSSYMTGTNIVIDGGVLCKTI